MPNRTNFRVQVIGPVCQLVAERGGSVEAVLWCRTSRCRE